MLNLSLLKIVRYIVYSLAFQTGVSTDCIF